MTAEGVGSSVTFAPTFTVTMTLTEDDAEALWEVLRQFSNRQAEPVSEEKRRRANALGDRLRRGLRAMGAVSPSLGSEPTS